MTTWLECMAIVRYLVSVYPLESREFSLSLRLDNVRRRAGLKQVPRWTYTSQLLAARRMTC